MNSGAGGFSVDKNRIITPAKLLENRKTPAPGAGDDVVAEVLKGAGFDAQKVYEGVEDTVLERSFTMEFEFDGFSVMVEDGKFAVRFEDSEDGLVTQYLAGEGEKEIEFPYLFEVDGAEKSLSEEDFLRIKRFIKGE